MRNKNRLTRALTSDVTATWLFLLPASLILLITAVAPLCYSFYISFFKYKLNTPNAVPVFIGLDNYTKIFTQKLFWTSLKNTAFFAVVSVAFEIILGLVLAMMLTNNKKRTRLIISVLLIPMIMAPVCSGTLWRMMLDRSTGVINYLITLLGLKSINFLGSSKYAIHSVIFVDVWRLTPWVTILLTSALKGISGSYIEAAVVDGASPLHIARTIILPLLSPVLMIVLMMRFTDAFKVFDTVYVMTGGGPGNSTEMLPNYIYNQALKYMNVGYAASLAFVFIGSMALLSVVFVWLRNRAYESVR
ncbi:MAG: sugar ABC transporter permease [Clostridia bacterium]|nr:sugar ABC transporter permease [Clostridia bacterium]